MTLASAIEDWKRFATAGGFEVDITLTTPDDVTTADIKGIAMKHHLSIDTDGREVSAKNAHITIIEADLVAANYPVRDAVNGEVKLKKHKVSYPDSTGNVKNYRISRTYPDETVGVITCILEKSE